MICRSSLGPGLRDRGFVAHPNPAPADTECLGDEGGVMVMR